MSSHITSDLEKIADEVLCIDEDRVMFHCAKDEICDMMGVARCRAVDFERLQNSDTSGQLVGRCMRHEYGIDVLVSDRFAFMQAFPEIPCDRITIDDYMALMLKGAPMQTGAKNTKGGER